MQDVKVEIEDEEDEEELREFLRWKTLGREHKQLNQALPT
jgi:hypothetical protein